MQDSEIRAIKKGDRLLDDEDKVWRATHDAVVNDEGAAQVTIVRGARVTVLTYRIGCRFRPEDGLVGDGGTTPPSVAAPSRTA